MKGKHEDDIPKVTQIKHNLFSINRLVVYYMKSYSYIFKDSATYRMNVNTCRCNSCQCSRYWCISTCKLYNKTCNLLCVTVVMCQCASFVLFVQAATHLHFESVHVHTTYMCTHSIIDTIYVYTFSNSVDAMWAKYKSEAQPIAASLRIHRHNNVHTL